MRDEAVNEIGRNACLNNVPGITQSKAECQKRPDIAFSAFRGEYDLHLVVPHGRVNRKLWIIL